MANRIQLRRDTTANWNNIDPVLADGEMGYDIVTNEIRIGNGSNVWSELSANTISGGGASTGNVTFSGINIIGDDNLRFQPNVSATDGYIDIYLTTGPDIHIDNNSGNLILGKDNSANVRLATEGNVQIRAQDVSSTSTWTFDPDGMTSFPDKTLWGAVDDDFYIKTTRTDPGNDADIEIIAADDLRLYAEGDQLELYANTSVEINADYNGSSKTWSFDATGNLTLPAGGIITEANVGLADALILTPANITYPGQQLRIYSTGGVVEGNHLHLTTGNLYATELYLGNDDYYVKLANTGNIELRATTQSLSSTALWTFDTTGNLTLPAGGQIQSPGGTGNVVIETNDGNNTRSWTFETNGNITFPDATTQGTAYQRVTGSWTVTTGSANYSFTVPQNGTYAMWVRGNIPNGIITWNATATVTNDNVPVLGQQYAWNYNAIIPMPLEITALPVQFIGTANTIITSNTYGGGPSNTFTFTVNNASGSSRTVYWGYVTQ